MSLRFGLWASTSRISGFEVSGIVGNIPQHSKCTGGKTVPLKAHGVKTRFIVDPQESRPIRLSFMGGRSRLGLWGRSKLCQASRNYTVCFFPCHCPKRYRPRPLSTQHQRLASHCNGPELSLESTRPQLYEACRGRRKV